ncbi:MAG: glycosyltransferase [Verrucomicrobia bacterium]|nr:glycosyltransferase [Verrucomicrobiota bacterium]
MLTSVIVPTLNNQAQLPVTLRQLADQPDIELIVVDGGSDDLSADIARQVTPYVFVSHPNRARQLNEGARHATGDILLFLQPGSFLLPGALLEIQRRMVAASAVGGAFDLHLDSPRRIFRTLERSYSRRARFWRLPRGEQGVFVWRQVFQRIGGFPDVPILEDMALARRLRGAGRLTFICEGLVASALRWNTHGPLKTALVDIWLNALAAVGAPPRQLRRVYDGWMRSVLVDDVNQRAQPAKARAVEREHDPMK